MHAMRLSFLALSVLTALAACTKSPTSRPNGYVSHTDDRWSSSTIKTCFEQDGFTLDKSTVATAVTREFAKAGFVFTGWENCKASANEDADLRVKFVKESQGSEVVDFGNRLKGLANGVVLGLSHECLNEYSGSHCLENVALHEFGHALGLHHEMNRQDDVDCRYQQILDRAGEPDALQIGDFDPDSIMNYCRIFAANDKDEYVGLSEQDVATLRARYESPMAQLATTGFYVLNSSSEFLGQVQGHRVTQYRFKLDLFETIDCRNPEGYSEPLDVETLIPQNVLEAQPRNRTLRLCLIGGDKDSHWQSFDLYTSKDFVLFQGDGTRPLPGAALRLSDYDKDYLKLDVTLAEPMPIAMISAELALRGKDNVSISSETKVLVSRDEKTLSVLFKRDRLRENGTVFVKRLNIFTRFYKGVFLSADAWDAPLLDFLSEGSAIPNTSLTLTEGFVETGRLALIKTLQLEPAKTDYATRRYLNVTVDTDSDINTFVLGFKLKGSDKTFDVYATRIFRQGVGRYRLAIDSSSMVFQGSYRLQSLKLYDYFGQETTLEVTESDSTLPGTSSKVPEIEITAGYPLNAKAPEITDVVAPDIFDLADTTKDRSVKVTVKSEIPVVSVSADFVGRHPRNTFPVTFSLPFFSDQKGPEFHIDPLYTFGMENDTYRLTSISIEDAGRNVTRVEVGPHDLVIPGTDIPVPQFKVIGGSYLEGPAVLSVTVDAVSYKKGNSVQVRIKTNEEQPLTSGTLVIRSMKNPNFNLELDFNNPGGTETLVTIPIDDKFPASGDYVLANVYAFDERLDMVSLSLINLDQTEYWMTQITAPRFTVL